MQSQNVNPFSLSFSFSHSFRLFRWSGAMLTPLQVRLVVGRLPPPFVAPQSRREMKDRLSGSSRREPRARSAHELSVWKSNLEILLGMRWATRKQFTLRRTALWTSVSSLSLTSEKKGSAKRAWEKERTRWINKSHESFSPKLTHSHASA